MRAGDELVDDMTTFFAEVFLFPIESTSFLSGWLLSILADPV